ncbi:MAG: hypothetical protein ACOYJJ_05000 [Anaerovoracaceae bacterium]|jgi:hypothetical protein
MKKEFFTIDEQVCGDLALKYFLKSSGADRTGPKYEKMRKQAMAMLERFRSCMELNGETVRFDGGEYKLEDRTLEIEDAVFHCNVFQQIRPDMLEGVYVYACTAGDYDFSEMDILNRVYADLWGNSYVEAIREMIRENLSREHRLSDSFGPGFFGMSTSSLLDLAKLLDFDKLGISVREPGVMEPQKSCAGIIFRVNDQYHELRSQCEYCSGSPISCSVCRAGRNV